MTGGADGSVGEGFDAMLPTSPISYGEGSHTFGGDGGGDAGGSGDDNGGGGAGGVEGSALLRSRYVSSIITHLLAHGLQNNHSP